MLASRIAESEKQLGQRRAGLRLWMKYSAIGGVG
jgi:hypothetical protein